MAKFWCIYAYNLILLVTCLTMLTTGQLSACGQEHISLNSIQPEKVIRFPDVDESTAILLADRTDDNNNVENFTDGFDNYTNAVTVK